MAVDPNVARSDLFYYTITLTSKDDFTESQEVEIVKWHRRGEYCFLVREFHADGRKHYHSMMAVRSPKTCSAVVKNLGRLYEKLSIHWQKGVSVKVKKLTHINGYFNYMLKEQAEDEVPLLLAGWKMSWIKEQAVSNLKEVPYKLLKGQTYMVQKNTSVELVLKYAKASGNAITCKASFVDVVYSMQVDGYQFDNIKKSSLYTNVMARCGCMRESKSVWEMELLSYD